MIKLSKKQLVEMAKDLGAYCFTSSLYTYENIVCSLSSYDITDYALSQCLNHDYLELLHKYNTRDYYKTVKKIAYSCGIYGNNGQLHEFIIHDRETDKVVDRYYTYY